jgi:hypothetical protein
MENIMRRFLPVCLVFAGLMSAVPAFAATLRVDDGNGTTYIYTCPNRCNVVEWDVNGIATRVEDSRGGVVTVQVIRQYTNEKQ